MSGASWVKVIDNDHIEYDSLEEALQHAADPRHLTVVYSDGRVEEVYQRSFDGMSEGTNNMIQRLTGPHR